MRFAIQAQQRHALRQFGVTGLHITVGPDEKRAFALEQVKARRAGRAPFECLAVDLTTPIDPEVARRALEQRRKIIELEMLQSGHSKTRVALALARWENGRSSPAVGRHAFLWVRIERSHDVFCRLHVVKPPEGSTHDEILQARALAEECGQAVVVHKGARVALELRADRAGSSVLSSVAVGPGDLEHPDAMELAAQGMEPSGIDLSEMGMAEGLQVWTKLDGLRRHALAEAQESELAREYWWSPQLQQVVDLLQLSIGDVITWHDAFARIDADSDGLVTFEELVGSTRLRDSRFVDFVADFMEVRASGRQLDFTAWAQVVSRVAMFGPEERSRFTFAFIDHEGTGGVPVTRLERACRELVASCPTGVPEAVVARSVRATLPPGAGLVTWPVFNALCESSPVLLYPVRELQDSFERLVMGPAWWKQKRVRYDHVRRSMRAAHDLGDVIRASGGAQDPALVATRFCEMVALRSKFVSQAFVERLPTGNVALLVLTPVAGKQLGLELGVSDSLPPGREVSALCLKDEVRAAVLEDVHRLGEEADLPESERLRAVHLVDKFFSVTDGLLLASSDPLSPPELNRRKIRRVFELDLARLVDESISGASATAAVAGKVRARAQAVLARLRGPDEAEHVRAMVQRALPRRLRGLMDRG